MAIPEKVLDMDLKDLEPIKAKLASASDELNTALSSIQDKLNAKQLGVEAFLTHELARDVGASNDNTGYRSVVFYELGYGKDDDGNWGLLVRRWEGRERIEHEEWDFFDGAYVWTRPLLRSPRDIRAAAIEHIPALIQALFAEAQSLLDKVERAKQLAKSLE
jgi:hypothetical protein